MNHRANSEEYNSEANSEEYNSEANPEEYNSEEKCLTTIERIASNAVLVNNRVE